MFKRLAFAAAACICSSAMADVEYSFAVSETASYNGETFSGSFTLVTDDFIASAATFQPDELLSCTVESSLGNPAWCIDQRFVFAGTVLEGIGFGLASAGITSSYNYFYFAPGTFGTPGDHVSGFPNQNATLTVSVVPEPATAVMLMLGLALVGARRMTR